MTVGAPAGWTEVKSGTVDGLQAKVWSRTATAGDAGTSVSVPTSAATKSDITVAAYRPTAGSTLSVGDQCPGAELVGRDPLTTPEVNVTEPSSWLVSYWGAKSSGTVAFTTPAGQQARAGSVGTGSGSISGELTDSGQPVAVGTRGGITADAGTSTSRAAMFSLVLVAQ